MAHKTVDVLLIEDSVNDADLVKEAIESGKKVIHLNVVRDGEEALDYLRRRGRFKTAVRPDLILLDLNLPKIDGREVLRELKADSDLGLIPIVVFTTSSAEEDILQSYQLHANAYIAKPVEFESFIKIVTQVTEFWLSLVVLPKRLK
jgi:two-component system response regulator